MSSFLSDRSPVCPDDLLIRARQARGAPMRLAVVRASASLPIVTAKQAYEEGIATPLLIGEAVKIRAEAEAIGWSLDSIEIHDCKGEQGAIDVAIALTGANKVDALMKGHLHSDVFMGGIVARDAGIRAETRMVHVFAMFPADGGKPLLISDAAVNVTPDTKTRQQTVKVLARTAIALGIETPRIAILSATETPIASIPSSLEARELCDWARENVPDAIVSGPLSFDLAISPDAVAIKGFAGDDVAGKADAVVVPEITAGNILFKAMVWFNGSCAAGVVTGGKVPIILTSRADPPSSRLASIALAALLS
ncbi:phosphate acyltransferase [Alphaproteobacteria bacterium LSUCC0684]